MMEVVVTTGAIGRAKLQTNCHRQQTNTQFLTGGMPFLLPNQQYQSTEGLFQSLPSFQVNEFFLVPLFILTAIFQVNLG